MLLSAKTVRVVPDITNDEFAAEENNRRLRNDLAAHAPHPPAIAASTLRQWKEAIAGAPPGSVAAPESIAVTTSGPGCGWQVDVV